MNLLLTDSKSGEKVIVNMEKVIHVRRAKACSGNPVWGATFSDEAERTILDFENKEFRAVRETVQEIYDLLKE